ncbi:MAG TPA: PAS domain S-box protein, partial [Longimicrobiaceae bacterium]|nr:PAS domain S-box protein [Longimicrobiaceae bacterium]
MDAPVLDRATPWMQLVQASPDGILAFDRSYRYTAWNPAMEHISGVRAERVLGRVAWEVFPFLKEEGEDVYFAAALAGEARSTGDRPFRVPESGRGGFFRADYAPLRDERGEVVGGMAIIRETTQSRNADEALRMQARVLESMSEGVSVSDEDGFILYTNPAEDRMFGYAPGELVGQHVTVQNDYPPEENRRIVGEVIEALKRDGVWTGEWRNRRKDGTPFTTYARITALELPGRRCWVCVQEDITEWRAAQAERERLIAELEQQAVDLEARTREAEQLKELTAALSEAAGVQEVGEVVMQRGVAALGADAGVLALAVPEGEEIEIVASIGYPEAACMGPGRRWPLRANLPIAEATRSHEAVLVESPEAWAERYGAYTHGGSRSAAWAALPVYRESGVSGAVLWTYHAPRPFGPAETALMLTVARLCSQALE